MYINYMYTQYIYIYNFISNIRIKKPNFKPMIYLIKTIEN